MTASSNIPPQTPINIRIAVENDLPQILTIEQSVHSHPWKPAHFESSFRQKHLFYIAEMSHLSEVEIVGYGIVSFGGGEAELLNIAVAEHHQGQSIATTLLNFLIDQVRDHADNMFLEVRESNTSAQHLYHKLGFNQVGLRPNYYPAGLNREAIRKTEQKATQNPVREDALIFALPILS